MKCRLSVSDLRSCVSIAALVADKRDDGSAGHVLLRADRGSVWAECAGEVSSASARRTATVETAGRIAVPMTIAEVLRHLPSDHVIDLSIRSGRLFGQTPEDSFELAGLVDYPEIAAQPIDESTVMAGDLRTAFRLAAPAIAVDDTSFSVRGVRLRATADGLVVEATDGRRAVMCDVKAQCPGTSSVVAPAIWVEQAARVLQGLQPEDPCRLTIQKGRVELAAADVWLSASALEKRFPDIEVLVPSRDRDPVRFDRADMLAAVRLQSVLTVGSDRILTMTLNPERMGIEVHSTGRHGHGDSFVPAVGITAAMSIRVHPDHVLGAVKSALFDEISALIRSPEEAILMDVAEGAIHVVMPLKG